MGKVSKYPAEMTQSIDDILAMCDEVTMKGTIVKTQLNKFQKYIGNHGSKEMENKGSLERY
jgi:hypothetical protein